MRKKDSDSDSPKPIERLPSENAVAGSGGADSVDMLLSGIAVAPSGARPSREQGGQAVYVSSHAPLPPREMPPEEPKVVVERRRPVPTVVLPGRRLVADEPTQTALARSGRRSRLGVAMLVALTSSALVVCGIFVGLRRWAAVQYPPSATPSVAAGGPAALPAGPFRPEPAGAVSTPPPLPRERVVDAASAPSRAGPLPPPTSKSSP